MALSDPRVDLVGLATKRPERAAENAAAGRRRGSGRTSVRSWIGSRDEGLGGSGATTLMGLLLSCAAGKGYGSAAMRIGVAREIKPQEYRVALTPAGARELVQRGTRSSSRQTRGRAASSRTPSTRRTAPGAPLSTRSGDRRPAPEGQGADRVRVLAAACGAHPLTYLHIAADEPLTRALVDSGIAAVAYETVETDDRRLPLLAPMSEVAGRPRQAGAHYLERPKGGRGLSLGGVAGVAPGKVVVIGGGIVGYNAAVIALGLGAQVTILERSVDRGYAIRVRRCTAASASSCRRHSRSRSPREADVVIGGRRSHPGRSRRSCSRARWCGG